MKDLRQCLIDCDMAMLRTIAQRWGVELTSNRQREVVEQLTQELVQPQSIADVLERLRPQERDALGSLIAAGGRNKSHLFVRQYGQIRAFGPGSLERERPWENPISAAEGLWYSGFIYKAFDEVEGQASEFIFIPQDVLPLLPEVENKRPALVVEVAATPSASRTGNLALLQDACALLSYLQNEDVKPLPDGGLARSDIESISNRLVGGDEADRLIFVHHLCQQLGLVKLTGGLVKPPPPETKRWLKAHPAEQLRSLQVAWRDDPDWNELWRIQSLNCDPTGWRNDPLLARKKILAHLAKCPPGQWLSLASFTRAIKENDPDFQRPDGNYTSWYIRQAATGQYLTGFEHWDQVEGALIVHLMTRPLHWLGAISLGYDTEGIPYSFQITSWGAAFLGSPGEMPAELPPQPMVVQPDFTIIAPARANLYDRFQLERVAAWQSSGDSYVYRLTRDSLARGLRQGIKIAMILAFLKRVSGDKVPPNVVSALRNWEKRRGQIRLRKAFLLQVESELTMEELIATPQTKAYLQDIISPRAAIITKDNWPRLLDELHKLGYLPKVDDEA